MLPTSVAVTTSLRQRLRVFVGFFITIPKAHRVMVITHHLLVAVALESGHGYGPL
ncbi:hypothetical protein UCMB321_4896 [Pseudomonas batumici]|uniref:Uncharacterized protein n=1 Tax=Pseudomonas batumici TaxID=226910 RepID=A0A0C2I8C4_9PSED|nr:hypothetical protein UCMB321_4896 [Pseudomonas batumici]